jgi:hypothetical protein
MIERDFSMAMHFLKVLCAPADFKRAYLQSASNRVYRTELAAGYVEGRVGIRLLFILGHEALVSSQTVARIPKTAMEYVNDLSVILTLFIQGDDAVLASLECNISDGGGGFEANAWAQLGLASCRLLDALGANRDSPTESIDQAIDSYCSP